MTTASAVHAFLEITLKVPPAKRLAAAGVYEQYKAPFLAKTPGAQSKLLLVRDDDVQVLHGFDSMELFNEDVVRALTPLLDAAPDVRLYAAK